MRCTQLSGSECIFKDPVTRRPSPEETGVANATLASEVSNVNVGLSKMQKELRRPSRVLSCVSMFGDAKCTQPPLAPRQEMEKIISDLATVQAPRFGVGGMRKTVVLASVLNGLRVRRSTRGENRSTDSFDGRVEQGSLTCAGLAVFCIRQDAVKKSERVVTTADVTMKSELQSLFSRVFNVEKDALSLFVGFGVQACISQYVCLRDVFRSGRAVAPPERGRDAGLCL